MGRKERPLESGPFHNFASDLRKLRAETGMTYRALARRAGYSASALSAAASGEALPTLDVLLAYVGACSGDMADWERRWGDLAAARLQPESGPRHGIIEDTGGRPLGDEPPSHGAPPVVAPADSEPVAETMVPGGSEGDTPSAAKPVPAMEAPPWADPPPAPGVRPPGGRHGRIRRGGIRHHIPFRRVQLGLAPIILAAAAITVYAIMLPAGQDNTRIVPPHTTAPVVTPPTSSGHEPIRSPGRAQSAGSTGQARNPAPSAGTGSAGQNTQPPPTASAPRPPTMLGSPDGNGYCKATGHGAIERTGSDAYGWHCADGAGIDGNAACAWTYGYSISQVIGRIQDFYDPRSWQCWRVTRELGAPNFNGYCEVTGQGPARLVSGNAYGWHCKANNGTGDDANAVCAWTYGYSTSQVTNLFQNFYDPNSWQCWG
jgi:hypothetical protein